MSGVPDFALETTWDFKFTTRQFSDGVPTTLAGTPVVDIYEDNSITQITGAETLTVDLDGVAGLNNLRIAMTAANGFATDSSYSAVVATGTVGGVSVVGEVICNFTVEKQSALRPTTAGRTLDVTATGAAGIDWGNVENPATAVDLSGTDIQLCDTVTTLTGHTAQTGDSFARLGAPAGASIAADLVVIDNFVDDLETRIPDVISLANINAEMDTALADVNLDHLVGTAAGIPVIVAGTYLDQIMDDGTATFDRTTDSLQAIRDTAPLGTAMRGTDSAALASVCTAARLAELDAANLPTDIDAILVDTNALNDTKVPDTISLANINGEVDTALNTAIPGSPTANSINERIAAIDDKLPTGNLSDFDVTAAMTESYAANAAAPSAAQALFAIHQMLMQFGISGTSITVRKLDDSTTAFVVTLDDATNPTDAKRV